MARSFVQYNLNIAQDSFRKKGDVYLVFEYMQHDLHGILDK